MPMTIDLQTFSYGVFCILILASGLTARLCKEEYTEDKTRPISGFWIFESENFTDRGKKLRRIFFLVSNLSLMAFFAILIIQETAS